VMSQMSNVYYHLFICCTTHYQSHREFINFVTSNWIVWSLNVVSCIIIRVAIFLHFTVFQYDKIRTQFLIKHAIITVSDHYLDLNMH
jgi:hypothetical protein